MKKLVLLIVAAWTMSAYAAEQITIAQFLSYADTETAYRLTGVVTEIRQSYYGNLILQDETASLLIYGINNFTSYDIQVNDTLTVEGVYVLYYGTPEIKSATYISHKRPSSGEEIIADFATDFTDWDEWIGKTVTFSNDFYYCDSWNNTIAPRRLRDPEEYGNEGSAEYLAAVAANTHDSCHLDNYPISYQLYRMGSIVRGLKATVTAANRLLAINTPEIIDNAFPVVHPEIGEPELLVCGANVENFFMTLGGYAGASNEEQLAVQKKKIASALYNIGADIFALCEVEQGPKALTFLVDTLNTMAGTEQYAFVNNGSTYYDAGMVCFIYRKDKVKPVGDYIFPYPVYEPQMRWREAIQCFEQLSNGEKFNLSMNHFWAKLSKTDTDREDNMQRLMTKLATVTTTDPDVLVMGDLNAFSMEESNRMLVREKGYVDLLMKYDPEGFSHMYDGLVGFLDHAYCSPSMEKQVTKAVSYHLNADTWKNGYAYSSGDETMYRFSDHDPILVGLKLGEGTQSLVETIEKENMPQKVMIGNTLYIIYNGVRYTVTGMRAE